MAIKVGDKIPAVKLMAAMEDGPTEISTEDFFAGRKVVLFATPGAFTATCSARHLPGFLDHADAFATKGVEAIACMAVNDVAVMGAWAKQHKVNDRLVMLADGSGHFTHALGLELDLTARGMGVRSQRFALVADDGVVTLLAVEEPGGFDVSRAEQVLAAL